MSKGIYIATNESNSGKSIVALGLMKIFLSKTPKVGYFRPIIDYNANGNRDNHINTVLSHFNLKVDYDECFALTRPEFINKLNSNKDGEIIDTIIEKYKALEERNDFMLVEGTDFSGEGVSIELDVNVYIAKNLGLPTVIVTNGFGKNLEDFISAMHLAYDSYVEKGVKVSAVIANKVEEKNRDTIVREVRRNVASDVIVNAIPLVSSLKNPTIREISNTIGAKV